jgi:hypothetical protein
MTTEEKQRDKLPHEELAQPVQDWLRVLASKWALEVRECESTEDARWMLFQYLAKMLRVMGEGIFNAQQEKLSELSREIAYDRDELLQMVRARLDRTDAALSMEQILSLVFVLELPIRAGRAGEPGEVGRGGALEGR